MLDLFTTIDPSVLAAIAAVCQDDANKQVNFENAFTFLPPTRPVAAKAAKKGRISFDANVLSTNMKAQVGLGGDGNKPGKGRTGVALRYHKYNKFQAPSAEQKAELNEWKEANGRSKEDKGGGKKGGGKRSPGSSPRNATNANKEWKSMISEMESCQTKMHKAIAEVQATSVAAIHATSTGVPSFQWATDPRAMTVGALTGVAAVAPEVMVERANVAMMKLTGILKSKEKKACGRHNPLHVMPLAEGDKASICHPVCTLVLAVMIGGALMGSDASLGATEWDSHANMAVVGSNCTIIATSGCYANVTPFSSNLRTMDMVEIGDAAIAYDDPILHVTYLLVMRNALLISTMNYNLISTFLIREAGLYVERHQNIKLQTLRLTTI